MTSESAVELAWSFWALINQRRLDEAFALLDEEGSYRPNCVQSWDDIPNRSAIVQSFMRRMCDALPDLCFIRRDGFASGDQVALEFTAYVKIAQTGRIYDQRYCMLMTLRNEKIFRIREFLDTEMELHLLEVVAPEVLQAPHLYGRGNS